MRAKPIFTYSLIAGALALPGPALALGLGKLTVDSALGQPLSARIELTAVSKEDLDSLRAKVADPNLYRQNNLTYQSTLSRTRISLESSGGVPYLKVTSPVSVQEPFLDLLVELDWSSGRVVREYTFLLDPPGMGTPMAATAPITTPRAATPATTRAATTAAAPTPAVASRGGAGAERYTVHRGDTLRAIAQQFKPDQATLDQMLDALFRGNSSAFDGANMNRLRAGAIVTIPTAAQVQAIAPEEATRVVHVQAEDWRNYRDRIAAAAPERGGGATREASGRIGVAVEDKTPAGAPGSDKLKVSRAAATGAAAASENGIARGQELKDAETRIAQLEKTVAEMQQALDLKNQTLAQLQGQAAIAKGGVAPAVTPPAPAATSAATPAATSTAAPAATSAATPAGTSAATPTPAAPAAATAAAEAPKPAAPKPAATNAAAPKAPAPEPQGFFAELLSNTPNWALGAGALAVLGGIAGLIAARRRKGTKFEDSIISGTDIKTNTVFGSTGGGVVNTGDNSLASDFSREGLGNIDTDEVDPIAEAEVYLAYGRDAQAEEILKDALKKDPQRQEIYLKLLEIHSQHNKPSAFETVASELFAVSHGQGDVWHKAVTLGRQLDPTNPMFQDEAAAGTTASTAPAAPAAAAVAAPFATGGSPLGAATLPLAPQGTASRATPLFSEDDISLVPQSAPSLKSAADILAGAESALARSSSTPVAAVAAAEKSKLSGKEAAGAAANAPSAGTPGSVKSAFDAPAGDLAERVDTSAAPPSFDLDFHLDDVDRPAPLGPAADARSEPLLSATHAPFAAPATPLDLDKLDLSFDPDRPPFEDPTPSVLDGQWHDAATKLDLAKAYQEMGDQEGAREILQEVLHEGDEQQKSEAKSLLAKLA
ncbi:MAG: FimV family protein [Betaproteobacteria bacterium]|nr:FimV family protein [Betaproteobacteria bacterium]